MYSMDVKDIRLNLLKSRLSFGTSNQMLSPSAMTRLYPVAIRSPRIVVMQQLRVFCGERGSLKSRVKAHSFKAISKRASGVNNLFVGV